MTQIILVGWPKSGPPVVRMVEQDEHPRTLANAALEAGRYERVALCTAYETISTAGKES